MDNFPISQLPIFIPKPLDSEIAELGLKYPAVLMDSHHIEWRSEVAKKIVKVSDLFIVNPVTHFLLYKDARNGKNFKIHAFSWKRLFYGFSRGYALRN